MRSTRRIRRPSSGEGSHWLSFSDLMSSLLLIFILIMFYIMYQYFDMYEISMAEIARQQYDLDQANADLASQQEKLTEAESQMLAQQIKLNAAQAELTSAESILEAQQAELTTAQTLLAEKETEIAAQKETLDALSIQLGNQQTQINEQQATLDAQKVTMDQQKATLDAQQETMNQQQLTLNAQQLTLDNQQQQIEALVGLKTRIITSLSEALKSANISAVVDPASGAIALESDVLFSTGKHELTKDGQKFVDSFLPVYLDVLFSEEYKPYVAEIIVEGHTDSTGGYIENLKLSQQRALAVASYILGDDYRSITNSQKRALRKVITANGRSFSDPVLDSKGREDYAASRRVVFKFRLTDEQMIQQLKSILESSGQED